MSTHPNPLAANPDPSTLAAWLQKNPPPAGGVRLSNLLRGVVAPVASAVQPVVQPIASAVDQGRQAYQDLYNKTVQGLSRTGTDYEKQAPANKQGLQTVVRAGLGAVGIPDPGSSGSPKDSDKQILQSVVPRLPKAQMKPEAIQNDIAQAASNNNTLYIKYQAPDWDEAQAYHVEPYSYRGNDNQVLMAYDKMNKTIKSFKLDNIISTQPNPDVTFKPRWDVEIKPTPAKK